MAQYLKPEDYKGQRYRFGYPSDDINPTLKRQKEYFLQVNHAFMADYVNNYCYIPFEFGSKRSFQELKMYATGQQPSEKLKDSIIGKGKKQADGTYKTKMNISWDTYYILTKMFDVMRQKNMSQEYDVEISCIDEDSLATKEADRQALKYLIHPQTQQFLQNSNYKLPQGQNPQQLGVQNDDDVDMYFDIGGYTMQREIACIAACNKTKIVSKYKVFQDACFDDLIAWALTGGKTYIEKSTKLVKIRKLHIDRCIIPYSDLNDFGDISRAGEIRIMTIADIRKENPSLTADQLLSLSKQFEWMNPEFKQAIGANGWANWSQINGFSAYNIDPISRVKIMVLDCQWLSTDIESHLKSSLSDGTVFFKEIPYEFQQDEKSKKNGAEVIRKNVIRKYYAQWVIGTEMFLDYGICKDVVYYGQDGNKTPKLDFFFAKTGNASLVERCIALVDDINLAVIKQRNTLATVPAAPGMAIQKDLLENVLLNGVLQQPEDILSALQERGVLYYNGLDDEGKPLYMAGGQKPIDFLDVTKIVGTLSTYSNIILEKTNELREVLGIPQGADASTPNPYDGLGKSQLSMQASNSALYPTFNSYSYLFTNMFDDVIKKWQIVAKDKGSTKIAFSPLGAKNLKILELGKDFTNAEFNCDIQMGMNDQQKQQMLADISAQKNLGEQTAGAQGLTAAEYMFIYDRIIGGNIREAMYVMAKIEDKKRKQAQQQAQQDQQNNIQSQQQTAQQNAQMQQQATSQSNAEKGFNAAMLQVIGDLGKQNNMLAEQVLKSKETMGQPVDPTVVGSHVQQNNQQIGALLQQTAAPLQAPQQGIQPPPDEQEQPQQEEAA